MIKTPPANNKKQINVYDPNVRLWTVLGLILFSLLVVLTRTFYLQIWNGDQYTDLARRQHERTIVLETERRPIFDAKGRILSVSVKVDSINAIPLKINQPEATAKKLSQILDLPYNNLLKKLKSGRAFVWIKRKVSPSISGPLRAQKLEGIEFVKEFRRYYPSGRFAGPLLGFTGIDLQGLEGIEYEYQSILEGAKNIYVIEHDGRQRVIPSDEDERDPLKENYALHLTLDSSIQYFAEQALQKGIASTEADSGVAIVMNSQTGAILALANWPTFDPNNFQESQRASYLNRAVTSGYEPGSTFKLITLASALEENLIQPGQAFYCEKGTYTIAGQTIHDVKPEEWLTVEQIIQKSSNICSAKIGLKIPKETFHQYIKKFGFGAKTNIGLSAEAVGKVPPANEWKQIDQVAISFGHEILASPIQIITAINTFARGGTRIEPYIVESVENSKGEHQREIRDEKDKVLYTFGPKQPQVVISPVNAKVIAQFMESVTHKEGTGNLADIPGYRVAGKTGTSEVFDEVTKSYSKKEHIASFVGFAPLQNPALTVLVVVENPKKWHYGGLAAAPIFREVVERSLNYLNIAPTEHLAKE